MSRGRAFVLFTSYANMNAVAEQAAAAPRLPHPDPGRGAQGRAARDLQDARPGAVLFATASFWQGVDVVGDQLSCVIIDKLPFASPGDPVVAARIDRLRNRGGNPFAEYQVPVAILMLKQGLGRLIRSASDRGILAVLDSRLVEKGYGRRFLESLPPARLVHDIAADRSVRRTALRERCGRDLRSAAPPWSGACAGAGRGSRRRSPGARRRRTGGPAGPPEERSPGLRRRPRRCRGTGRPEPPRRRSRRGSGRAGPRSRARPWPGGPRGAAGSASATPTTSGERGDGRADEAEVEDDPRHGLRPGEPPDAHLRHRREEGRGHRHEGHGAEQVAARASG